MSDETPVTEDASRLPEKTKDDPKGEAPRILKAVILHKSVPESRRAFFRTALGGVAAAAAGVAAMGCSESEYDVVVDSKGNCRCHAVCTCDAEGDNGRKQEAQYSGDVCTCNLVCTCESVCTSNSGGGGVYYYYV